MRTTFLTVVRYLAIVATLAAIAGCNEDRYTAPTGCTDEEGCLAPRYCLEGTCVDPDGWPGDAYLPDVGTDTDRPDVDTPDVDEDTDIDTDLDTWPDTLIDVEPDVQPDAPFDVQPDAPFDVQPDAPFDVQPDAPFDVQPDAPFDVQPDAPFDVRPDAPFDVQPDAPFDVQPDAPFDVRPDAPFDVRPDAPFDVRPDAPFDVRPDAPFDVRPDVPFDVDPDVPPGPVCVTAFQSVLSFGTLEIGRSFTRTLTVENCGLTAARIESIDLPVDYATEPRRFTLAPGERRSISITFSARTVGARDGTLVMRIQDAVALTVALRANVNDTPPRSCIEPFADDSFDFRRVRVGDRASQTMLFINCGETPLFVTDARIGDGDAFTAEGDLVRPIAPGEIFEVFVTFAPRTPGLFEGELSLLVDDGSLLFGGSFFGVGFTESIGPILEISTPRVDFGTIDSRDTARQTVQFCNRGDEVLEIYEFGFDGDPNFELLLEDFVYAPGECRRVTVVFAPDSVVGGVEREFGGVFYVGSSGGEAELIVRGVGTSVAFPRFCVQPLTPEIFVELPPGSSQVESATFFNCGNEPLEIFDIFINGPERIMSINDIVGDFPVPPGDAFDVDILLRGDGSDFADGELVVDTIGGTASVAIFVTSGCGEPQAGASNSIRGPFTDSLSLVSGQTVYLDSGVTADGDFDVAWNQLAGPARVTLFDTAFFGRVSAPLSQVGTYRFQVDVATADGACDYSSVVEVNVQRNDVGEGLRFVVTWRTPGDDDEFSDPGTDIDLHVLPKASPRGARWDSDNDCYYGNRETWWGGRLLRDELDGIGPEIVVIEDPSDAEIYQVAVYYFSDKGFGPSQATLRIFLDGIQIAAADRTLRNSGQAWLAAEVTGRGESVVLPDFSNFDGFPP